MQRLSPSTAQNTHVTELVSAVFSLIGFWSKGSLENHGSFGGTVRGFHPECLLQKNGPKRRHREIHDAKQTPKFKTELREGVSLRELFFSNDCLTLDLQDFGILRLLGILGLNAHVAHLQPC